MPVLARNSHRFALKILKPTTVVLPRLTPPRPSQLLNRPAHRKFSAATPAMFALTPFRGAPGTQPKTFSKQSTLPRLPIPELAATFERYLKSISPILRQKEAQGQLDGSTAQKELDKRRQWIADFLKEGGLGRTLQQRLVGELRMKLQSARSVLGTG